MSMPHRGPDYAGVERDCVQEWHFCGGRDGVPPAVTPVYDEDGIVLWRADCLDGLAALQPESVDCVVTSPPYWSQRRYSGEQTRIWGGDLACSHAWESDICARCGAWRGAYGLEPHPARYVANTLIVLRALRRVLKPRGVVLWNIGDGYAGSGKGDGDTKSTNRGNPHSRPSAHQRQGATSQRKGRANVDMQGTDALRGRTPGLKPKDMLAMPWRVGLAAQADGWWLRADIIWAKPNPTPESVRDRPTKSHEYVLLLTKARRYYWNALRDPLANPNRVRADVVGRWDNSEPRTDGGRNTPSVWNIATQPSPLPHFASFPEELARRCILAACPPGGTVVDCFSGTGTTLVVARQLGRKAIGMDISAAYCDLAADRLRYGVRGTLAKAAGQLALGGK